MTAPQDVSPTAGEVVAEQGDWPDEEWFLVDYLGATIHRGDGTLLGEMAVLDDPPFEVEDGVPEFIRVEAQPGRGGVDSNGTLTVSVLLEVNGPNRSAVKALMRQVTAAMVALDRGGSHRGVLVDDATNTSADAPEIARDDDDKRRSALWTLAWRRHFGETVLTV